ncbi:MAG: Jag N-terminal domain-containing protein [Syntrophales bacterium]|nr:Jag N-terminal domain-containing protein [Syntrophales bacterium]
MREVIEIEAKTIDEAIEKACELFQMPREKLQIEILSEGTPGFLGLGSKKAKIRASLLHIDINDVELEIDEIGKVGIEASEISQIPESGALQSTTEHNQNLSTKAKELLEGILERMQLSWPVSVEEKEDTIRLTIMGDGEGLIIGKRGRNLDALEYILNKAINRSANGNKKIIVDAESYRKKREEKLISLAQRIGKKVKKTRKAVTLENLTAHERQIIHLTLRNDPHVITKSEGEGENRKITIFPVRKRVRKKKTDTTRKKKEEK